MEGSIESGKPVLVQVQYVVRAHQAGGEEAIAAHGHLPLGGHLCRGPEVPDHTPCVAVVGPGVELQEVGDEHGRDVRHGPTTWGVHLLGRRKEINR